MQRNNRLIIAAITAILITLVVYFASDNNELNNAVITNDVNYEETANNVIGDVNNEVIVNEIEGNIEEPNETIDVIEIPPLSPEDEQAVEFQEADLENEAFERQGEVAYNGSEKTPNIKLGTYKGLTYYSQADKRWAKDMYSAINDKSQTMLASGCGPTAAAMIVSSIKGEITPKVMGDLFVQYGYRSRNSGTYWSGFKWIADVFDIKLQQTSSFNTMLSKLKDNNYVIACCKEGLFTYGGHFVVIVGINGDTLKIYDPYLYNGKFTTSTRKGKVTLKGNTVSISTSNFKKYANAKGYFCYQNERDTVKENNTEIMVNENLETLVKSVNYKVKITAGDGLNIREGAGTSYKKVGSYAKNTEVTIIAEKDGWGKTQKGWISLEYTTKVSTAPNTTSSSNKTTYTTGKYKVTASVLNVRSGPGTNYSTKTYQQLTKDARNQNKKQGNYYTNGYRKGVVCTITQVSGSWGKTPSGWISLTYCKKQ